MREAHLPGIFFLIASNLLFSQSKADFPGLDSCITTFQTLPILQCAAQNQPASENFLISQ